MLHEHIEAYWCEVAQVARSMPYELIVTAAEQLLACQRRGGTIFVLGNGGSAATAAHFACDLAKGTRTNGLPTFRVVALNDNVPLLTAWANDTSYEHVFAEQLVALVRPGDLVVMISASGNSPNVLLAADVATTVGATTIALTGRTGGQLGQLADLTIPVPSDSIEQVEDAHLMVAHSLCVVLREQLRAEVSAAVRLLAPRPTPVAIELGR